ncbi:MAG: hypothetical protein ACHP7A_06430 [Caulobacterales bacterium]
MSRYGAPDHRGPAAVAGLTMRLREKASTPALRDVSRLQGAIAPQHVAADPDDSSRACHDPRSGNPAPLLEWWQARELQVVENLQRRGLIGRG